MSDLLEAATLTEEEARRICGTVWVGSGPTGAEVIDWDYDVVLAARDKALRAVVEWLEERERAWLTVAAADEEVGAFGFVAQELHDELDAGIKGE